MVASESAMLRSRRRVGSERWAVLASARAHSVVSEMRKAVGALWVESCEGLTTYAVVCLLCNGSAQWVPMRRAARLQGSTPT